MTRTVIVGGPKTGKTTLARKLSPKAFHTDSVLPSGWSNTSATVATWFTRADAQVIEGVAAPRALRKWLAANPTGKPCDEIVHLTRPRLARTPGQEAMAKGCETVFNEIAPELRRRGVVIKEGDDT